MRDDSCFTARARNVAHIAMPGARNIIGVCVYMHVYDNGSVCFRMECVT